MSRQREPELNEAVIKTAALALLSELSPRQWQTIIALRERHAAGQLSIEAWQNATGATLEGKGGAQRAVERWA